jgi:hypothetical protein
MLVLTDLATHLQTLLITEAEDAARQTGCVRRRRRFSGASLVQTLVFGWLHQPRAPVDALAETAAELGIEVTPQALDKRFTAPTSQCLARVMTCALERVVAAEPVALELLQRFAGVYVYDSTTVSLPAALVAQFPGSGQDGAGQRPAALKCQVQLELQTGTLELQIEPARQTDVRSELVRQPLPVGALRLADRGYLDFDRLADDTAAGVYWITRLQAHTIIAGAGRRGALGAWLRACTADQVDMEVAVGGSGSLRARLVAYRVPAWVAAKRRQRLQQRAKKKGRKVSAEQDALCAWNVCLTNLPATLLRVLEAGVVLRARWQVELLFKLWKSHGGLCAAPNLRPARVLCEVYAKLIGMIVQHWLLLASAGSSLQWRWVQAARRVRVRAVAVAAALADLAALVAVLARIQRRIQRCCRRPRRPHQPSTYELLDDPAQVVFLEIEPPHDTTLEQAA